MKKTLTILCLTIAVLLGSIGNSESADFQKGLTAYNSGDFATAAREWTPLANKEIVNAGVGVTIEGSKSNKHFGMTIEEAQEIENPIVPFGSEEMWEEFIRADIMDRYLSSWKLHRN
jgi:hypothetical protein